MVEKNKQAQSETFPIHTEKNLLDDEVLSIAFGINVYKDLLLPKKLLVEGSSDKIILEKIFNLKKIKDCGITNGIGSNIVQVASKYNDDQTSIRVLLDSDDEGIGYKEKILQIGGVFNEECVFTIKDLIGNIKDGATIEDLLPKKFVEQQVQKIFVDDKNITTFELDETIPFIEQVKRHFSISANEKYKLDQLKKIISETYSPTKKTIEENLLLNQLIANLEKRL